MKDLYIKFKTTKLDKDHRFKEIESDVYGCKEYVWNGYLKSTWHFQLVDEKKNKIPYIDGDNCGITTDTELTNEEFLVNNALNIQEDNKIYHYMNKNSTLAYNGTWRKVFLYVRIYDNDENCRWIAINLQHDREDDLATLNAIDQINKRTKHKSTN